MSPVPEAPSEFVHPNALRAWAVAVFAAALASAVGLAFFEGSSLLWVPLVVFGALAMAAEHFAVVMPNNASASVSVMICLAAVVVFRVDAPLLGPLLVGMASGLYIPHLLQRDWLRLGLNIGMFGVATLAAAATYDAFVTSSTPPIGLGIAAAVFAASAYWAVNVAVLSVAMAFRRGTSFKAEVFDVWGWAEIEIVVFAILGLFMGRMYVELGAWSLALFVGPVLIARQAFGAYLGLRRTHEAMLETLVRALEAKDRYTAGHVERVATFAGYIGLELGFSPARLRRLHDAALMHDIGKLVVPNQLLNKPGKLTASEFDEIRKHEAATVEMLSSIDDLAPSVAGVAHGLGAPIESRIVHVADAFDAMTSTRAYRRALTQDAAIAELHAKSGTQFDPSCVSALVAALKRRGEVYGAGVELRIEFETAPVVGVGSAGLGDLAPDPT